MEYIKLCDNTKYLITGREDIINENSFDFNDSKFLEIKVEGKNIIIKILQIKDKNKLFNFVLKNATIMNFDMNKYEIAFNDVKIDSIDIAKDGNEMYIAISLIEHNDYRFTCDSMELQSVKDFDIADIEVIDETLKDAVKKD